MSNLNGFFCLGFIYFLHKSKFRTKNIIYDASIYIDLFEDLDKVNDIFTNEYVFSLFSLINQINNYFLKISI
jgi:hypothetical protein